MAQAAFLQHLLHALDGETVAVEQRADTLEKIDILGPVITPPAGALHGLDLDKTAFPEAQHMLGHVKLDRDFTDGAERFRGLVRIGERR